MISLIYVSSAVRLFTDAELVELLRVSRENNQQENVTGMLLYKGGNFLQVLEGPEEAVLRLYQKISQDPRHVDVMQLIKESIQERHFPDWSMGFQNVDQLSPEDLPGFTLFLEDDFASEAFRQNPKRAYIILLNFKNNMR